MHNTFDVVQTDETYTVRSHNFPEFSGSGASETEAVDALNRQILHYIDNNKKEFKLRTKQRLKQGLACLCGEKLSGDVLAVYKGRSF